MLALLLQNTDGFLQIVKGVKLEGPVLVVVKLAAQFCKYSRANVKAIQILSHHDPQIFLVLKVRHLLTSDIFLHLNGASSVGKILANVGSHTVERCVQSLELIQGEGKFLTLVIFDRHFHGASFFKRDIGELS